MTTEHQKHCFVAFNVLGNTVSGKGANRACMTPMLSSTDANAPGMSARGTNCIYKDSKWRDMLEHPIDAMQQCILMEYALKSKANSLSHRRGCEAASALFKCHVRVPFKLSMHGGQQQTLKPQKRLRVCVYPAQMLCIIQAEHASNP